jgi:urease accessory protein
MPDDSLRSGSPEPVVSAAQAAQAATFDANRARGSVALDVAAVHGRTRRMRVFEDGSLRVRFPNSGDGALEAVTVNTAGGIAGGDRFGFTASVGEGAALSVTTAAAEKVYRSLGADACVDVRLEVAGGGRFTWVPQETILFDRARLRRSFEVNLAADASVLLAEAIVFGRAAMGEVVEQARVIDRWRVRRGGRLIFADTLRLDGEVARKLGASAVARGGTAVATVLIAPGTEAMTSAVRALQDRFAGEVGISAWNAIALARFCAPDGTALRHDMTAVLAALRVPLPRLWLN